MPSERPLVDMQAVYPRSTKHAMLTKIRLDFDKMFKRLLTVLHREIAYLMIESKKRPLGKDESSALVSYLKVIRDLKKDEQAALEAMSNEELEKLVKGEKK